MKTTGPRNPMKHDPPRQPSPAPWGEKQRARDDGAVPGQLHLRLVYVPAAADPPSGEAHGAHPVGAELEHGAGR